MNGFSQGAFPVTLVLFAVEHMQMSSSAVGGMLTLNVLGMVLTTTQATKLSDRMHSRKSLMVPAMSAAARCGGHLALARALLVPVRVLPLPH